MAKKDAKPQDQTKAVQKKAEQASSKLQKSSRNDPPLPYLLDFSFTLAALVILFAGVITSGLSILHGSSIVMAALRGCIASFALGAVFWLLNYFLAKEVIETAIKEFESARKGEEQGESTREVQA
jgi:ABC-type transport system involved in cytochrome bd biosynthesis fused ATPase/permease subunit